MICRFTCKICGRTWVFESRFINPAEFSCPFKNLGEHMPQMKKLVVRQGEKKSKHERHAESIEQALRDVAKEVKNGDLEVPFTLEFTGPGGAEYNISISTPEAADEITTFGFMF